MVTTLQDPRLEPLQMRLFGPFEVWIDGSPLPRLRSRKVYWLLALLALRAGTPVQRSWLAGTLWPDSSHSAGLATLRRELTGLRRALGSAAGRLRSPTPRTLLLDLCPGEVDLLAFDAALRQGGSLEEAVSLYRGPLLEGCAEEWVLQERSCREQAFLQALDRLANTARAHGDLSAAERYWRRVIEIDPLRESAQRGLMELLAAGGNYAAALRTYRDLRLRLHAELNTEPDAASAALFQRLRQEAREKAVRSAVSGVRRGDDSFLATPPGNVVTPHAARRTRHGSEASPHNLPLQLTSFVGRLKEGMEVKELLGRTRLLTLTGAGGTGKTRLALKVASALLPAFPDGIRLVDLAALADPDLVPQMVATVLGLQEQPDSSLTQILVDHLRPKQILLLLDNCEHLLTACALLAEALLRGCPRVRILATSREGLRIPGEIAYRLPSLSTPDPDTRFASPADLAHYEAVRLFVERAASAAPSFRLTEQSAPAAVRICHHLDGIPLAIELAAARMRALPVEAIAARLDDRFRLLTGGSRTALPRHQTLRATIDWSYDLLSEREKILLQRLSAFAGGWTLQAAEAICPGGEIAPCDVLDLLTALVEKSLVQHEEGCESPRGRWPRYRLLETVRHYARDRHIEAGASEGAQERHRDWYLRLAEQADSELHGPEMLAWLERLEPEHDNLRAALAWSEKAGDAEAGMRLAAAVGRFWWRRGHFAESRRWLEGMLSMGPQTRDLPRSAFVRARALWKAGRAALYQGDFKRAQALTEESLALRRRLGDRCGIGVCLYSLASVAQYQGDDQRASRFCAESAALLRELEQRSDLAFALQVGAEVACQQADFHRAVALSEEALALFRELNSPLGIAYTLRVLGRALCQQGESRRAVTLCEESVARFRAQQDERCIALALGDLAWVAQRCGAPERAEELYREGLVLLHAIGNRGHLCGYLEGLAELAAAREQPARAARLFGAADALRDSTGTRRSPVERPEYEIGVSAVRSRLPDDALTAAWAEGHMMSIEEAIAFALEP